ncbi:hypothetical protein M422DRAFT_267021 [Sphaerobolus stellatus SS14]|uniref:Uncharacterized protein n=1 Tax=Sphaerobolus stellatus (strain SS14) TaxID=990650 RepID=A0A0C9U9Y8_SPHS4|nr:hypothetical protein M422DRAFT_267021 [Sphaerobolus stellatus SS14]
MEAYTPRTVARKCVKCQYGQEAQATNKYKSASQIDDNEMTDSRSESVSDDNSSIEGDDGDEEGKAEAHTFCGIVRQLQRLVGEDEDYFDVGIEGENPTTGFGSVRRVQFFFGHKHLFTISELFNWDKRYG